MIDKAAKEGSQTYTRKKIQHYSYALNQTIGKGYSSKVYQGRNDDTNQPVAIKVIELKLLKNQINRTLLDSEIDILKQLRDLPHLLSLHDVFTTKNNTYLVTELCHSDLAKRIKQQLSQTQVINFMQQLVKGYLEFQQRGIIHRDLKPANILITENDQLKIADFGFGIRTEQLPKSSKYNVGSPLYMAPESLKRNEYSFKSDIWALGIIFYEMLLNDTPWKAKNQKELLRKVQTEPIQSIISTKQISSVSKDFLVKTLRIDKHRRMSPKELEAFVFDHSCGNVLAEKNLNSALKPTFKAQQLTLNSPSCRPRGKVDRSQEKEAAFKHIHDKSVHKALTNNESIHNFNFENVPQMSSPEDFRRAREQERSARIQTAKSEAANRQNKKLISKILISQVHFCRFLFKLMQKVKQSSKIGVVSGIKVQVYDCLMRSYAGIIKHKIQQVISFEQSNYIRCEGYSDYKISTDYEKLMKIGRQYKDRYKVQIQRYWNEEYSLSSEPTNSMIRHLYEGLQKTVEAMGQPQEEIGMVSKDVVILDYLITSQQLIQMVNSNPDAYERFARKSRIEEIVEGKTVDIHYDLYLQIMERVKQIMQKKQFVSFGAEASNRELIAA